MINFARQVSKMFGWLKKGKNDDAADKKTAVAAPAPGGKPSKDELIRQAMLNAQAARETIGQETLDKVAEILQKQARKAQLEKMRAALVEKIASNPENVSDHLREMLRDKKTDH